MDPETERERDWTEDQIASLLFNQTPVSMS